RSLIAWVVAWCVFREMPRIRFCARRRDEECRSIMKNKATVLSLGSLLAALIFVVIISTPVFAAAPIFNNQSLSIPENSVPGGATTPAKVAVFDPEGEHIPPNPPSPDTTLEFQVTGGTGSAI